MLLRKFNFQSSSLPYCVELPLALRCLFCGADELAARRGAPAENFAQPGGVGLLPTYHLIVERESDFAYSSTCAQMESHLQTICALRNSGHGKLAASWISFDDGHASQYRYAFPLLQKYGVRAVFFSIVGWADRRPDYMTSAQLRELVSHGHDVQSHGFSHRMLPLCSDSELIQELQVSRTELQQKLGSPVDAISIPLGRWDSRVLKACAVAGYKRVYTSDPFPAVRRAEGVDIIGRFMVRRSTQAHEIERVLLARPDSLRLMRTMHQCKRLARRVMGEGFYDRIWGVVASRRTLTEVRSEYDPHRGPQ
jgi:peptidoglycan/xylan/chitin deacetylase (PgdA/CDA1 family)